MRSFLFWFGPIDTYIRNPVRLGFSRAPKGKSRFPVWSIAVVSSMSQCCLADTIQLKKGGALTGTVIPSKSGDTVVIKTQDGVTIQISKDQIAKTLPKSEREAAYEKSVSEHDDSIASHLEIEKECLDRTQKELSNAHLERIVELDPNDSKIWSRLGYRYDKYIGKYVRRDAYFARRGLTRGATSNVTTLHAAVLENAMDAAQKKKAKIAKEVTVAFDNLSSQTKSLKALEYLQNLNDPLAVDKVTDILIDMAKRGANTSLPFEILLRMPGQSATGAFIRIARNTEVPIHDVNKALDALVRTETGRDIAIYAFIADLRPPATANPNVAYIDRAGYNLETIGDERAIPSLINALTNKTRVQINTPPTTSFDKNTGGISQSAGGGARIAEVTNKQAGVLSALATISGASYGYDREAWLDWFATKNTKLNLDLRRYD